MDSAKLEYGPTGWVKVAFLCIAGAGFIAPIGLCAYVTTTRNERLDLRDILLLLFFLIWVSWLFLTILRSHMVIDGTRIIVRTAFREQTADVSEIDGFRTLRLDTVLRLAGGRGAITIDHRVFAVDDRFRDWLRQFPDLNQRVSRAKGRT
jgi:hypothetical protein